MTLNGNITKVMTDVERNRSPTAAGQYNWVSEFGPPKYQRFLSYSTGWLCAIGYHTFLASVCFMVGTIIQGLIIINNESYVFQAWHGTLLTIAVMSFAIIFNTVVAGKLPLTEGVAVIIHMCGLFGVIVPLWVLSPRGDSHEVLLEFTNLGGWPTNGLAAMVGLTTPLSIWIGYETPVHMAEEVHDASRNLPKSILGAVALNGLLSFLMAMTLIFCVGDAEAVLTAADNYNGYAFLAIFQNAVSNPHALNMMVFLVIFGLTNCAISETAVASRQVWSFARDNGLPFSGWLSQVHPGQNIPLRAVLVSFCFTSLLSLINIGSSVALNAINSLAGVSVLTSYLISIGCLIWRRLYGAPLTPHEWSLGRFGLPINIAAFCCVLPLWFFAL
jgi:choline transport protein